MEALFGHGSVALDLDGVLLDQESFEKKQFELAERVVYTDAVWDN